MNLLTRRSTWRFPPAYILWLKHPIRIHPAEIHPSSGAWSKQKLNFTSKIPEVPPVLAQSTCVTPHNVRPGVIQRMLAAIINEGPAITRLLEVVGPTNIPGCVRPVVIRPAIERAVIRARAQQALDVLDEQPDIMPARADLNTPAAIATEPLVFRVVAPGHDPGPGVIQRVCPPVVPRQPVGSVIPFPAHAAARFSRACCLHQIAQCGLIYSAAATELGIADQPGAADTGAIWPDRRDPYFLQHATPAEPVTGHDRVGSNLAHEFSPAVVAFRMRTGAVRCAITWRPVHTHPTRTQVPDRQRHLSAGLSRG